jgi:hypothetical protein
LVLGAQSILQQHCMDDTPSSHATKFDSLSGGPVFSNLRSVDPDAEGPYPKQKETGK